MTGSSPREHWNARYAEDTWPEEPSPWLVANADLLTPPGRALDIAGGTGRNAIWLAHRGWEVTIVDASDVGLRIATRNAEARGLTLDVVHADLGVDPLPEGPFDLALLFHYLDRALFPRIPAVLRPGGLLVGAIATVRNLERHPRPPREHVLDEGELPGLLDGLELVRYEETWRDDRHNASFVARRPA